MKCELVKKQEYSPVQFERIGIGEVFLWFYNEKPYGQPLLKISEREYINLTDKTKTQLDYSSASEPINRGLIVQGKFTYSY